ncbi:hypothetical protein ECC02_007653 [Trypanosoma cruzi]|uniref:Uncharacterized protein n=1 Tax=Trypanosoma cruzi TaxID=5693 RepID=A0A7J6XY22_TRYCR|nr:hypothetical protein ECC02_007653 [Trypanosoma cruzi]
MYGIAVWHWGASPASRSTPNSAQYQKSKIIAGIPKGSRMEDAVLRAKLRPLPDVVLRRRFRCALRCETRGSALRSSAPIVRRPPLAMVPLRMTPTKSRHQTCSRWIARRFRRKNPSPYPEGKHHEARTDSTVEPGVESEAAAMPCLNGTPISVARAGAGSTQCGHRSERIASRIGIRSHRAPSHRQALHCLERQSSQARPSSSTPCERAPSRHPTRYFVESCPSCSDRGSEESAYGCSLSLAAAACPGKKLVMRQPGGHPNPRSSQTHGPPSWSHWPNASFSPDGTSQKLAAPL